MKYTIFISNFFGETSMVVENIEFEIISEDVNTPQLLLDYWKFGEKRTFALSLKDVIEKYGIQTPSILTKEVGKIGFLQVSRLKDCGRCCDKYEFYVRSNFTYYLDRVKGLDNKCIKCFNEKNIKYAKDTLEYFKNNYFPLQPKLIENQELSYLEKIHLYLLIENYIRNIGKVRKWYSLHALSGYFYGDILEILADKGFILNHDNKLDLMSKQTDLGILYRWNQNIFDSSLSEEIFNFLKFNFEYHTEIVIPPQFENINDWIVELFKDIKECKLELVDIKDLENFLFDMRISEIYALAEFVCASNKIPLCKDNALEFEFIRMVDKYNLEQIYNIFNYQATYTTSTLYKISVSEHDSLKFSKDKLFTKNIGYFITRMEQKSPDQHYSKSLPLSWEQSEFEQFVSAHIIGSAEKWEKLTPKQILSCWLNAVEYDIEE